MKVSALKVCVVSLLIILLSSPVGTPVRAQQGLCATQTGPHMPDLIVDQPLLGSQIFLTQESFPGSSCRVKDGCVTSPGNHLLLRFNGSTANVGKAALVIGNPANCSTLFYLDACENEYHFAGFADYRVWTLDGYNNWVATRDLTTPVSTGINAQLISAAIAQGQLITARKQGFCMVDTSPFLPNAGPAAFLDCDTNQGISVGWEDQYPPQLPCQFVQIDNLVSGTYVLEMHVNPELILPESDYTNNTGAVQFQFTAKHGNTGPSITVIQ
jgi:lysyl oxidase